MGGVKTMSYTENYSGSVHYSGSVSYSYPASEHGGSGTAHYSGSVPVSVTLFVNTDPFDGSVNKFNKNVDILTGSVVAMETAQCLAIRETAKEVSEALLNGFFGTINSELSQQIQALDSAVKAILGKIMEQGKTVSEKKKQMEFDYNGITSRYLSHFLNLDKECYRRIHELDKHSFNLSEKVQKGLLSETPSNMAALNLLGFEETSSSKTFILISSLNRKSLDVLQTLHNYITQELRINTAVNSFLFDESIAGKTLIYIPVVWTESDMLEDTSANQESFIQDNFNEQMKHAITGKTDDFCSCLSQTDWKVMPEPEREALYKEFKTLAELEFHDSDNETEQRVYKTMLSLWKDSKLHSLERSV
jgi:hypothetical protein